MLESGREPSVRAGSLGTSRDGFIYDEDPLVGHKGLTKLEWQNKPSKRRRQSDGKA